MSLPKAEKYLRHINSKGKSVKVYKLNNTYYTYHTHEDVTGKICHAFKIKQYRKKISIKDNNKS